MLLPAALLLTVLLLTVLWPDSRIPPAHRFNADGFAGYPFTHFALS